MNKNEVQCFSAITLNSVKVITEVVSVTSKKGTKRKHFHVEYDSPACRGIKKIFGIMLQGKAAEVEVNTGDYINITCAKVFTSARDEDKGIETFGINEPEQITVVVHDGGFIPAENV